MTNIRVASVKISRKLVQVGIKKLKRSDELRPVMAYVRIVARIKLADAVSIKNHMGETFTGNPTQITYSFRFGTWNVTMPDQPKTYKDGSLILNGDGRTPQWNKGKKLCKSGISDTEFAKEFPGLAKLCTETLSTDKEDKTENKTEEENTVTTTN